jgi:DNA repair exonuclease SbcCD ATPase subunit
VLKCPTCGIPLSYHKKDNLLKTIHLDLDNAKGMIQPIDADNEINSINLSHDNQ